MLDQINSSESPTGHKNTNILNNSNNKNNYRKNKTRNTNKISISPNPTNGLYELSITDQIFNSTEKDSFHVPLSVIEKIDINEFPVGLRILPFDKILDGKVVDLALITAMKNLNGKIASVEFYDCRRAEHVADYGMLYPLFQETLVDLLILNKKLKPKILENSFDGEIFHLHGSIELPSNLIGEIFKSTMDFYFTTALVVVDAGKKIHEFLRKEVKLPVKPSKVAQLKLHQ